MEYSNIISVPFCSTSHSGLLQSFFSLYPMVNFAGQVLISESTASNVRGLIVASLEKLKRGMSILLSVSLVGCQMYLDKVILYGL